MSKYYLIEANEDSYTIQADDLDSALASAIEMDTCDEYTITELVELKGSKYRFTKNTGYSMKKVK